MHGYDISVATSDIDSAYSSRITPATITRRVLQGIGGAACVLFAAAMPWADFAPSGMTIGSVIFTMPLLIAVGITILIGLGFFIASVWGLVKRLPKHTRFGVFVITAATLFSVAGIEYGYLRHGGLVAYEYRSAVRMIAYALGIALLACSIPEELGPRLAVFIRSRHAKPRHIIALAVAVTAAGALIGAIVLDGVPHIIDGTSYLLQARMLWSGQLALDAPMYPQLFAAELVQFRLTDAGYFSKYPIGWPALLGLFDSIGIAWMANAVLAGLLVVLTYAVIAEQGAKQLAGISAFIAAICPWLWLNAGTMMPHLASAVWLWTFLWLFLRAIRLRSHRYAMLSGLTLGAAVLTRPADAAFFAIPCVVASIAWMTRRPDVWLKRLPLIGLGALPGVAAYLLINHHLSGSGATSTYGSGHGQMLFQQVPDSPMHALAWLHEGWVGLNTHWLAGAVPVAMLILCGIIFGRPYLRGQRLPLACAACLFICYAVFVFGGRAWVGPRWYVPLIPAIAMLIAAGLKAASQAGRVRSAGGVLAAGYLRAALVAGVVVFVVALPAHLIDLIDTPPHGVDGQVVQAAEKAGLHNAVVALPVSGLDPATGKPNYKRGIAGMWHMQIPFEDSPVIYISAIDGWQQMASQAWPDRELYSMNASAGDMSIQPVVKPDADTNAGQAR